MASGINVQLFITRLFKSIFLIPFIYVCVLYIANLITLVFQNFAAKVYFRAQS